MNAWVVIPAKSFARAKSRLTHLSDAHRYTLARSLFRHVIDCAAASVQVAGILVLTNGDDVQQLARERGAEVLRDELHATAIDSMNDIRPGYLGRIVDTGLAYLAARGVEVTLVLMSDLPHLQVEDIDHMLQRLDEHDVALAPDRHEQGTNALALSHTRGAHTCFGHPDSLTRHLAYAEQHGLGVCVYRSSSIAMDIDWPADMTDSISLIGTGSVGSRDYT